MKKIYLDNAATTRVDDRVIAAMKPYFSEIYGNPSSLHSFGAEAKEAVDEARRTIALFLHCSPEELIFTSGGSEADNLAIRGLISQLRSVATNSLPKSFKIDRSESVRPHVITTAIEHHAVLHTIEDLEKEGLIEASYVKPESDGVINPKDVIDEIKENTVLISVMYVNNETGAIQPIHEISRLLSKVNEKREYYESTPKDHLIHIKNHKRIYFHTDAVQATEYLNMDVDWLGVDLLTISAHKIHGPKGVGALYVRKGTPLKTLTTGGSQEFRRRAGTENVPGIVGFAEAIKLAEELKGKEFTERGISKSDGIKKMIKLKKKLIDGLVSSIGNTTLNGNIISSSPAIANISFFNAEGEAIILNLDFLGTAVSSGSACTSRSLEPSHVLSAMGIPPEKAHGSIRFSLSKYTTDEEIKYLLEVMPGIIEKLRAMSPFK